MHLSTAIKFLYTHPDTDECFLETDLCDQSCTNTAGGYTCSCGTGYTLDNNGRTCSGKFVCAHGYHQE